MIYVVIDTNVIVSALITKNPNAATTRVLELALMGEIVPLYDQDVLDEYLEVLTRKKFKLKEDSIQYIIKTITINGIDTLRTSFLEDMPDEDDRVFYELSLSEPDSLLITGNSKHFPRTPRVVSPSEFLRIIEDNNT
ncbi:MAG: putative toxin-antitoxin system toxin component, PIN family [Prevotella sp.]|jgi:probable toxin-antitoxin system toxin component, PIN family|nr:putative toxin-antitoxin system toxin component, PIN family [uncultured Prevotella sp.]MBF1638573.1 putative toxin-antitoxin system toxin component, PIN family [Prevotella sp.]